MSSSLELPPGTLPGAPSARRNEGATIATAASLDTVGTARRDEGGTIPPADTAHPAPAAADLRTDDRLPTQLPATLGRYRLIHLLGKGGMGRVYLAHDTQLDRPVALKIPQFRDDEDSSTLARFHREARAAATILHANVCPIYDVGEINGFPYLTMAYIEGKLLDAWSRAEPLTQLQIANLVRKLALALQEAHTRGVVHRDLKPSNIIIDRRGEPMIMDFGLARRTGSAEVQMTQTGVLMGTPAYMAPEQARGRVNEMGPACDIYSLGVILYELISGRLPFDGDTMTMLSQLLLEEPPPLSRFCRDVDPQLEAICGKAMAKKAEDRYRSMADFAAALFEYADSKTLTSQHRPALASDPTLALKASPPRKDADAEGEAASPGSVGAGRTEPQGPRRKRPDSGRGKKDGSDLNAWQWLAAGAAALGLPILTCGIYWATHSSTSHTAAPAALASAHTPVVRASEPAPGETILPDPAPKPTSEPVRSLPIAPKPTVEQARSVPADPPAMPYQVPARRVESHPVLSHLMARSGTCHIVLSELGAPVEVFLDDSPTPIPLSEQPLNLPLGVHHLWVRGRGYKDIHQTFTIHAGDNPPVSVTLQRRATARINRLGGDVGQQPGSGWPGGPGMGGPGPDGHWPGGPGPMPGQGPPPPPPPRPGPRPGSW